MQPAPQHRRPGQRTIIASGPALPAGHAGRGLRPAGLPASAAAACRRSLGCMRARSAHRPGSSAACLRSRGSVEAEHRVRLGQGLSQFRAVALGHAADRDHGSGCARIPCGRRPPSSVSMESFLACSMKPQVLTMMTSAWSGSSTRRKPSASSRAASSSESTSLRAQPRLDAGGPAVRHDPFARLAQHLIQVVRFDENLTWLAAF